MLCSFFIKGAVLVAVPMFNGGSAEEQEGKPKYSAVNVEEQTKINRRKGEDQQMPGRSAVASTAIDPTLREQQDDLVIDSPEELVRQKIGGAHGVGQK